MPEVQALLLECDHIGVVSDLQDIVPAEEIMRTALDLLQLAIAAPVPEDIASKTFWHGTKKAENARKIWQDGLKPQFIEKPKAMLAPVPGRVYLTEDLSYAMIYAYGANMIGKAPYKMLVERYGRYGYVFKIDGRTLVDLLPDEDSIGEMTSKVLQKQDPYRFKLYWLGDLARKTCAPSTLRRIVEGESAIWARAGKALLKRLTDAQVIELIRAGSHVSHGGALPISECWRMDGLRSAEFKKDGSNFFELATKVRSISDII